MLRRGGVVLAGSIPRGAWDPARHNANAPDSFAVDVAARRQWPAKRWAVGLEPRTPREWLQYSRRNLAYAYNGALRAADSLAGALALYTEMRARGVGVDGDTLSLLLARAARDGQVDVEDVFRLFDELVGLGARADVGAVETLQTVLEHGAGKPAEWREAQRRRLVALYRGIADDEIARLGGRAVDPLLAAQLARVRGNLRRLDAGLGPAVCARYLAVVDSAEALLKGVHDFLWEFVPAEAPALDVPALGLRVPFVGGVMRRPPARAAGPKGASDVDVNVDDFEDAAVCGVVLAAVGRLVGAPLHDPRPVSERRVYLALLTMLTASGVLYTADLLAQLMDIVKFARGPRGRREEDAIRLLRYALRGSAAAGEVAYRRLWQQLRAAVDGRVVGRYLASRNLWGRRRLCPDDHNNFPPFQALLGGSGEAPAKDTGADALHEGDDPRPRPAPLEPQRTADALQLRWEDAKRLIEKTEVLRIDKEEVENRRRIDKSARPFQDRMEVFTGLAVLLRTAAMGQRYGSLEAAYAIHAVGEDTAPSPSTFTPSHSSGEPAGHSNNTDDDEIFFPDSLSYEVWGSILRCVRELYEDMERFMAEHEKLGLEPEFECWEAMIITLRSVMDFCALQIQQRKTVPNATTDGVVERLFDDAAAFRGRLVEESKNRFNGRFRILWLQEV